MVAGVDRRQNPEIGRAETGGNDGNLEEITEAHPGWLGSDLGFRILGTRKRRRDARNL